MTNFRIKYTSCISKIAQETDSEITTAKTTRTSLHKATDCFVYIIIITEINACFTNISPKLAGTQRKCQSQIDININSHKKM